MTSCVKTLLPDKTYYALKRQISNINKELDKVVMVKQNRKACRIVKIN